jgi:hypothetical protein
MRTVTLPKDKQPRAREIEVAVGWAGFAGGNTS